jgi:Protein of unknown function (DUF2568)
VTVLALNLVLAFALEVAALVALAIVGDHVGGIALAVAFPVIAAVLWGLFAAPKARYDSPPAKAATKTLVFSGAAVGLIGIGQVALGVVFAVLVILNTVALTALGEPG